MKFAALCVRAALATALAMNVPMVQSRAAAQEAGTTAAPVSEGKGEAGAKTVDSKSGWVVISTPNGHRLVRVSPNWRGLRGAGVPPVVVSDQDGGEGAAAAEPAREPVSFGPQGPAAAGGAVEGAAATPAAPTADGGTARPSVVGGENPTVDGPRPLMLGSAWAPEQAGLGVTAPTSPAGLIVQPAAAGGIQLSWQDLSTNETGFEVMRQRQAGQNWNRSTTMRVDADTTVLVDTPGNGSYRYRVRAVNGAGTSEFTPWGTMQVVGQAPMAPTQALAADLGNGGEIRVTWVDNSGDETGFELERETQEGSVWKDPRTLTAGPNQTSYTDLASVGTFRYRLRSINSAGASAYTPWTTVSVQAVTPAAPTNLQAADQGNAWHMRLTWADNSENESGFQIERQAQTGGVWGHTVTIWVQANVATYTDSVGVGTFRYRARAMNSYGASAFTAWAVSEITSSDPTAPGAPTGVMASDIGNRRALVSWTDASDNETAFEIERSPSFSTGTVTVGANVVGYIDQCGAGEFSYRVRATNAAGASAYSSWANVTVSEVAPAAPSNLQAVAEGNDGVRLTWTDNANNESGFRIERQTQEAGGSWGSVTTLTAVADATTLTDEAGQGTHRYRIAATNFAGDSPFTSWSTIGLSGGWTVFTPSADTRIIYVSSVSGNDANDGLSQDRPVRTVGRGYSLLRSGYPDWLLLKCGETFDTGTIVISKSGRSEAERMMIGSYGTGNRPVVRTGSSSFITRNGGSGNGTTGGSHLAIVGIHAVPHTRGSSNNPMGIFWVGGGANLLIEDCYFERYGTGIVVQSDSTAAPSNTKVRRTVVVESYTTGAHSQGMYAWGINGLLIEDCVFDRNGWNPGVAEATIFNHSLYLGTACRNVTVRNCITARGSSHGLQLRPGGVAENNLIVQNSIGLLLGGGDPTPGTHTHGISGVLRGNVILEGKDITSSLRRGQGIDLANVGHEGAIIDRNVIAHKLVSGAGAAISFLSSGYGSGVGVNNVSLTGNVVYNWRGPVAIYAAPSSPPSPSSFSAVSGNSFANNDFQDGGSTSSPLIDTFSTSSSVASFAGGTYHSSRSGSSWFTVGGGGRSFSQWVSATGESNAQALARQYPGANRSVGSYAATQGLASTTEAFLMEARRQSKSNWRPQFTADAVNDYIREGFGIQYP